MVGGANDARFADFNCKDHAGPMWQGGLAAGKPSVPWYQIHVRGIPGWRACRRPQARPTQFVQGNNGERSLGPAPGEVAAMQRPMCRPPSTFTADHRPDASTHRPHAPFARGDASVAGDFCRRLAWAPEGHALSYGRIRSLRNAISVGTAPRRVRRATQLRKHFAAGPPAALTAL
jgi:hypothetical protein